MVCSFHLLAGRTHGPNTQCPSDLHLGAGVFFLIFFDVVVFSLLKTNFGFIRWK